MKINLVFLISKFGICWTSCFSQLGFEVLIHLFKKTYLTIETKLLLIQTVSDVVKPENLTVEKRFRFVFKNPTQKSQD